MKAGFPIETVGVADAIDTGISWSMRYSEIDSCIAAGLDWSKWEMNVYPKEIKAEVVIWNKMQKLIRLHTQAAIAAKAKK